MAADADVKSAAAGLVDGAMYNAGQSCCGIERVFVHADVADSFIAECETLLAKYVLGDPLDEATSMGPLSSAKAAQTMVAQIQDAKDKGAKVHCGGQTSTIDKGCFFEPTLLTQVNQNMLVMREENFGPILPIMVVNDDEQAISQINDSDLGLTSSIFTQDVNKAQHFAQTVQAGTIFMNRCDFLDPSLPWTGYKDSGKGSTLSTYGFYHLTQRKSLNFKQL